MYKLTLIQIGDGVGAVFPPELLAKLGLKIDDELYAIDEPNGLRIMTRKQDEEEQIRLGREIMKDHHRVLRELAK